MTGERSFLSELKSFAEEYANNQLFNYIAQVQSSETSFGAKEINDALWGTIRLTPLESAILDSPLLQRLRFIRQLGVVHWVYPGAVHTRFEHTLGVLHRVQEILTALDRSIQEEGVDHRIDPNLAAALRLCALLHDIGHGVFSHVSEAGLDHFDEIRVALIEFAEHHHPANPKLSELLASLVIESSAFHSLISELLMKLNHPIKFAKHAPAETATQLISIIKNAILGNPIDDRIPLLHELISGPFDADKLDYFVRDATLAGIPSVLDISRLTQKLTVRAVTQRNLPSTIASQVQGGYPTYILFGLKWSGASILDELHLARILLFAKIYRHHKVLAIEAMIESLFVALGETASPISLIKFAQIYTDDQLLHTAAPELAQQFDPPLNVSSAQIAFASDILGRLRSRRLFVKGFVVQSPFPGDPWGDDTSQRAGLRRFVQDIENPPEARAITTLLAREIAEIARLAPSAMGSNFRTDFVRDSLVISTKPRLSGGTQIDRALVFHGEHIVPYKDLTVNRVAWADAYNFSSASGYIFCPREISVACFVAIEKLLRVKYDVITPTIAIQLSKQKPDRVQNLKRALDDLGYYDNVPFDIRPMPARLDRADVEAFVEEMNTKFAAVDEPSLVAAGRRPSDFRGRLLVWLSQFRKDSHVSCAIQMIRNIRVLRREDTKAALLSFVAKHPEFKGATICLLGSQKDSSSVQSYFALDATGSFFGPMTVEEAADKKSTGPVIFVDDIVGSGGQARNIVGHWFDIDGYKNENLGEQRNLFGEVERSFLKERRIGFVFIAGWDEGLETLKDCCTKIGLQATVYAHIREKEIPFAFDQPIEGMSAEETQSFRAKCFDIGRKLLLSQSVPEELANERALGYGNRAMLLVSTYNVPTQVITCFWQEGTYEGVYWQPLIRRRKKE